MKQYLLKILQYVNHKTCEWISLLQEEPEVLPVIQEELIHEKNELSLYDLVPQLEESDCDSVYARVRVGDIVLAAMPLSNEKLSQIEEQHRIRPYLVMYKDNKMITAYMGTSNTQRISHSLYYPLSKTDYDLWKDGVIVLTETVSLSKERLIRVLDHMRNEDMAKINEVLQKGNTNPMISPRFDLNTEHRLHTVVKKNNKLYYYWKKDGNNHILLKLHQEKGPIPVNYKGRLYYIFPSNLKSVESLYEYVPAGTLSNSIHTQLSKYRRSCRPADDFAENHYFRYPIGSLLRYNDKVYIYLFSSHKRMYGLDEHMCSMDIPVMSRLKDDCVPIGNNRIPIDDLSPVLKRLAEHNFRCQWLYDYLPETNTA